jgi:hypothetical protein
MILQGVVVPETDDFTHDGDVAGVGYKLLDFFNEGISTYRTIHSEFFERCAELREVGVRSSDDCVNVSRA